MCGVCPGDIDEVTGDEATFEISRVAQNEEGIEDQPHQHLTLCSTCNDGLSQSPEVSRTKVWLLSQVRRAGQEEQRAVLAYLQKKFGATQ
jgi:hypothetical protein